MCSSDLPFSAAATPKMPSRAERTIWMTLNTLVIFGVTRERIRQIENKAIRKLRHPSRAKKIKDFYC